MVELDQFKTIMNAYEEPLAEMRIHFDVAGKERRIEELERKIEEPGFWDNPEESQELMKELKNLKELVETIHGLYTSYEDINLLIEMGYEDEDPAMVKELEEEIHTFEKVFEKLKIQTLLSGEYDACNAIMTIHAGAGGTESCDWAGMLYRMYCRWAERKGFSLQVLDFLDGDIAGIKAVTFEVKGENAYGYLKSEKGVHRLVRISPFNSAGKRQTSFASCDVLLIWKMILILKLMKMI